MNSFSDRVSPQLSFAAARTDQRPR
jgi:hypothetical protein